MVPCQGSDGHSTPFTERPGPCGNAADAAGKTALKTTFVADCVSASCYTSVD